MARRLTRRDFERIGLAGSLSALAGCPSQDTVAPPRSDGEIACPAASGDDFDFVVVGSGAGGGPLACNLARAGYRVALIEAGGDPDSFARKVPALHAASVEEPDLRWDFWARTYSNFNLQRDNERFDPSEDGVLYPRAGALGGCTAHNALVLICPHESDWDAIAHETGDPTFRATEMRKYFERLEKCEYAPAGGSSRHGDHGWLPTSIASPLLAAKDGQLLSIIEAAAEEAADLRPNLVGEAILDAIDPTRALFDPNDYRAVRSSSEGLFFVPLSTEHGNRVGTREYVRRVAAACPDRLVILLDSLATRVVFDDEKRATGVEILEGARLYRAAAGSDTCPEPGPAKLIRAKREVILSGGVFNTPQLLMLSGVGPRDELDALGIPIVSDLCGVGQNLQDRYEIGVVSEMAEDFAVLDGANLPAATHGRLDPALVEWQRSGKGPYSSNGIVSALIKKSHPELSVPDLFLFGLVGRFHGYYRGYSQELVRTKNHFTWGVLKAHTKNRAGEVHLRSADPRDPPDINFRYFEEGSPGYEEDLAAVVTGVETVRRIMRHAGNCVVGEVIPGPSVATREQIANYVRAHAWGHHASCSNKMGAKTDPTSVVDSRFRVRGTRGLRVVDASVFPRIPGFFVVSSVYMLAEKASDVILEDVAVRG